MVRSRSDLLLLTNLSLRLFGDGPLDAIMGDLEGGEVVVEIVFVCVNFDSTSEVSNERNGGSGEQFGRVDGGKIPSISGEMGP